MKLFPQVVYVFKSNAERKTYLAIGKSELPDNIAFHSINLPEHEYKEWAEADFIIVAPAGIIVLEVKGGGVKFDQTVWTTTDRYGSENKLQESPFDQAKGARYGLEERLKKLLPSTLVQKINFGFAVVFPDVIFDVSSTEWDEELIFDARGFDRRTIDSWITKLFKYWLEKTPKKQRLTIEELSQISKVLRPELDRVPALISRVGTVFEDLVKLTEDQYRYLDGLLVQKRVIVEGGAGTGKTFLAVEASRRLKMSGKNVLYICRSPVLAWNIREKLNTSMVNVLDFSALAEKARRKTVPLFDVLVVDEGQDFLDMDSMLLIDGLFEKGLEQGQWLFFMDRNNQGSIYEKPDPDALAYLEGAGMPWPLMDNCRNTQQIATATMLLTGGDIGRARVKGDGLTVDYIDYNGEEQYISKVEDVLEKWLEVEQVQPGDITVLSFTDWDKSILGKVDKKYRKKFEVIDSVTGANWHRSSLTFSNVVDFKGLENRYILIVDLEYFEDSSSDLSKLYVAMTRANAVVSLLLPRQVKSLFDRYQVQNLPAVQEHFLKGA